MFFLGRLCFPNPVEFFFVEFARSVQVIFDRFAFLVLLRPGERMGTGWHWIAAFALGRKLHHELGNRGSALLRHCGAQQSDSVQYLTGFLDSFIAFLVAYRFVFAFE